MTRITPCLWFDGKAEEAARFYVSLLPNSHFDRVQRWPEGTPFAGQVLTAEFTVGDVHFVALNGGPQFQFTEALSFQIATPDQAETNRLWDALIADGGQPSQCGWLKDRYGLSWQIVPERLTELLASTEPGVAASVMQAMMGMTRIDIAALEAAARQPAEA